MLVHHCIFGEQNHIDRSSDKNNKAHCMYNLHLYIFTILVNFVFVITIYTIHLPMADCKGSRFCNWFLLRSYKYYH